jgi:hypothetical protein
LFCPFAIPGFGQQRFFSDDKTGRTSPGTSSSALFLGFSALFDQCLLKKQYSSGYLHVPYGYNDADSYLGGKFHNNFWNYTFGLGLTPCPDDSFEF